MSTDTIARAAGGVIEDVLVLEHTTRRLTTAEGWTFTRVRTGCVRVQKGDFTAYLTEDESYMVTDYLRMTEPR